MSTNKSDGTRKREEAGAFARLAATKYKKMYNGEWHPVRTIRRDKETGDVRHGQYTWADHRLLTSPASRALRSHASQVVLIAIVGKYGKQTEDGFKGDFQRGITFTPTDVFEFGISDGTATEALRKLVAFGFVVMTQRGRKAERGRRARSNQYRLSDAWRASLNTTNDPDIDLANLPVMDDPRHLPKLMELVGEMGDDCIWCQNEASAVKEEFLEREVLDKTRAGQKQPRAGQSLTHSGSNPGPLRSSGEATGEGGTGEVSTGEARYPRDHPDHDRSVNSLPSGLASGHIDPVAADEEAIETIGRNQQRDAQIRAEGLTPIAENLDEAVEALPIPPQRADSESEAPGQ